MKNKRIEIQPHWREQIKCLRCWLDGYVAGGGTPLVGQDVLRQIMVAIDNVKD